MGTLTVKELISILEKMPQDLPVISGEYRSIAEPEIVEDISWWFEEHCNKKDIDKAVML